MSNTPRTAPREFRTFALSATCDACAAIIKFRNKHPEIDIPDRKAIRIYYNTPLHRLIEHRTHLDIQWVKKDDVEVT